MRVFIRSKAANKAEEALIEKQATQHWKNFRKYVDDGIAERVKSGLITPKEMGKIKSSINIYPPEELMKGVTTAEEALARFDKYGVYPNLSEVGKKGAGGSYGDLLKFERQGFEKGARGTAFFLDNGRVRTGGVDLNHMLEAHGFYTPEAIAKAAGENLDSALHSLTDKNLKDTQKYVKRSVERMQWARGKLRVKPSANDTALESINKQLQDLWKKFQDAETKIDAKTGKTMPKTADNIKAQQEVLEEFSKLSAKLETILKDAADDSLLMQSLANAITGSAPKVSMLFRSLLENTGTKWTKTALEVKQGMSRIGDYVKGETGTLTKAARQIGFLNALGAYWAIKDLPEIYVNKGSTEAAARFSLSLVTLAVPEIALGELAAALATGIAELAVDYVGSYGYKLVTGTQDCFDLIEGIYTVKGRETQALGEGIKKCHNVKIQQLACDTYDKHGLANSIQALQEKGYSMSIDPKRVPSEINSLIACHAENASRRFDEPTKTDKGVENALISKCSNAIITAWLEQRDVVLEEINTLASEIERSDLRVSFDSNETIIKEGEKNATVKTFAEFIPAPDNVSEMIKAKLQCIGGKDSSPFVYKKFAWKREGIKAGTTDKNSEFVFDKKGKGTICADAEIEYGVFNTPSSLTPKNSSGKINKTNCVDVEITGEIKTEKITASTTGDNKVKAPERSETGRFISLVADVKSKRDMKSFRFVWTHEGGFAGDAPIEDHLRTIRYDKPGTYEIKVELFDIIDTSKEKDVKKAKLAEAKHTIIIESSVKDAKIELKITAPAYIVLEDSINLAVEVMADERIKAKLKPPVWYAQRGEVVALSPSEEDILAARQGIGQGTEMSYRPKIAGGYTFYVDVFGEGVGGPAAQSSQKVAVRCKILQREGAWANELCRLDNAYTDPPLSVIVMTDRSNATSGERINVNAVGQGGKTPYQFTWTGSVEGQGKSIIFVPSQSNRSLSVEIKDARGQTAKESITFTVDRPLIPMEGLKDKALFGTWLNARAIAGENKSILWRSSPTVTMKPQESGEGRTSILFDRMGKVKVWAEARIKKGDVYETVAETEQVEVTVLPPDGRIEVDPLIQAVGGAVTAEVKLAQTPEYGTVKYVWIDPPQPKREQISDAKIKFILGDASPVPIEVELRGSRGNETIVNLKRPYDPEGKPTATEVAVGNESTGSTKKKGGAAKLIKAKEMVSTGKLTEGIALAEEAGAIDPSSTEAFAYAAKIKSEQALITDKLKNFIVFADQENFAEAEKILGEIKKLHPLYQPVIEADAILKTKKAAYEKKIKDSDEKLAQAKSM
jgi:hypothetical protein